MRAADRQARLARIALCLLLAGALGLRLWGVAHGLPYVYNVDENAHFVPRAIGLFGHGWDPGYFVNPPAYTYVLHLLLWAFYGGRAAVSDAFTDDPTTVFVLARVLSAVLGTAAVGLLYLAGARLAGRRAGLVAAAVLAVAFLPVFYGHLGLNDAPLLAPLCLSLAGSAGALRRGRRGDWAMAGIGLGLACATKYTGGIALLPLLAAAVHRRAWRALIAAGALAVAAFFAADPYALLDPRETWRALHHQSAAAGGGKLGLGDGGALGYYLQTFTWGLGWVPALAALAGAAVLAVRDRPAFWLLVPAPVAFLAFMATQERYFGRWLMPVLPIACLLAAFAAVALARRRPAVLALATAALCAQGLVHAVHVDRVLSRDDTRNLARAWMVAHVPPRTKIVVEPGVMPDAWATDIGPVAGARWIKFPTSRARFEQDGTPIPSGRRPVVNVEDYERTLQPQLVGDYERLGWCWVVIGSTQEGRAQADPAEVPGAIAYYRRLRRDSVLAYAAAPWSRPVAFNFDFSFDYHPLAYERPGPLVEIRRLRRGSCAAYPATSWR